MQVIDFPDETIIDIFVLIFLYKGMKCAFTKAESAWVIEFKLGDRSDEKKNHFK